jgi:hypothetical protein
MARRRRAIAAKIKAGLLEAAAPVGRRRGDDVNDE